MIVLANASDEGKVMFIGSVLLSHVILAYSNSRVRELALNGRRIKVSEKPGSIRKYARRLEMAEELVEEMGRSDFAVRLGLINSESAKASKAGTGKRPAPESEVVTM